MLNLKPSCKAIPLRPPLRIIVSKKPVKTKFGYHVIEVLDVRDSKPVSLEQATPELKAMLTQQTIAEVFTSLNKGAKIERFDLDGKPIENPVPAE